jgi:hypothetical protein
MSKQPPLALTNTSRRAEATQEAEENLGMGVNILEDILMEKPRDKGGSPKAPKIDEAYAPDMTCILGQQQKGFIVGGSRGYIFFYELEKNLNFNNTMNFRIKYPTNDFRVRAITSSTNDSLISIVGGNHSTAS